MTDAFKVGDRVCVATNANDVHFEGREAIGTVTNVNPAESDFEQYISEGRIVVLEDGGTLDQWVRPQDLTLVERVYQPTVGQDENTGLATQLEAATEAVNDGDLWQIGWKHLDLHKAVHDLARAIQQEADASASLALASGRVLGTRQRIAALKADLAELEAAK